MSIISDFVEKCWALINSKNGKILSPDLAKVSDRKNIKILTPKQML